MFRRRIIEKRTYDKEKLKPVLKCSICNGEQVAGFKNRQTGKFATQKTWHNSWRWMS